MACRPCICAVPTPPPPPAPLPPVVVPQQCPPVPVCSPISLPPPPPRPRPLPPPPPAFICPPTPQCPPVPVCPRPEPCPPPPPRVLPPPPPRCLPAPLPAFVAPPPPQLPPPVVRQPPQIIPQNDCCCNCVQLCRATGIAGRARGARTWMGGTSIWEDLLGGLSGYPPPRSPPQYLEPTEAKCNNRMLEMAILENISPDLEASKRRIQMAAERALGAPVNVVCGASEFSFVVHTDQFCQASSQGVSCYAFGTSPQG